MPFLEVFAERSRVTVGGCGIEFFSLGGAISRVGEDDTAYSNRGAAFDFLAAATWDHPRQDESNIGGTRDHWNALTRFTRSVYVSDLGADGNTRVRESLWPGEVPAPRGAEKGMGHRNVFHLNANVSVPG